MGTQQNTQRESKEDLEIQKLKNDIYLQKNPLRNPAHWAPFATLVGTSFALIWAISTGWFTNQNDLLKIEKNNLLSEIKQFRIDSTRIHKGIEEKNVEMKRLADSLSVQKVELSKIAAENSTLFNSNTNLNETNKILNQKVLTLTDKRQLNQLYEKRIAGLLYQDSMLRKRIDVTTKFIDDARTKIHLRYISHHTIAKQMSSDGKTSLTAAYLSRSLDENYEYVLDLLGKIQTRLH